MAARCCYYSCVTGQWVWYNTSATSSGEIFQRDDQWVYGYEEALIESSREEERAVGEQARMKQTDEGSQADKSSGRNEERESSLQNHTDGEHLGVAARWRQSDCWNEERRKRDGLLSSVVSNCRLAKRRIQKVGAATCRHRTRVGACLLLLC
ncbi:hypothetical protein JG687_00019260 [Phytophthora cactorum]|uniref:Uncharacterized protein n=1 Tax=Phytophthora cactorum TaxID=29920 RepID=A0A8T1TM10_9STRA|nr:hypothetical protein JG687_00019260 [Phytophthora cactorum]